MLSALHLHCICNLSAFFSWIADESCATDNRQQKYRDWKWFKRGFTMFRVSGMQTQVETSRNSPGSYWTAPTGLLESYSSRDPIVYCICTVQKVGAGCKKIQSRTSKLHGMADDSFGNWSLQLVATSKHFYYCFCLLYNIPSLLLR